MSGFLLLGGLPVARIHTCCDCQNQSGGGGHAADELDSFEQQFPYNFEGVSPGAQRCTRAFFAIDAFWCSFNLIVQFL